MKFLIFLTACLVSAHSLIPDEEVAQKWIEFQAKYQKSYKSAVQWKKRMSIFRENLEKYEAHNELYAQGKISYTKGINKFADMTEDEFLDYVKGGLLQSSTRRVEEIFIEENYGNNIESVDWRLHGAVTPARDQGLCGPAYAYSAVGAIEGQLKIVKGIIANLSVQNIVDCTSEYGNKGCGGGLISNSFQYVQENGIESEEQYPLRGPADKCSFEKYRSVAKLQAFADISPKSEPTLQYAIATIGPISIAMDATRNLVGYKSGIFDDEEFCSSSELNHAALVVGFGSENGVDYYVIKNSFGEDWGENGFFKIVRNKNNRCGIATMASYPILE